MTITFPEFDARLAVLLRDHIPGISAELTDFAVAYWDGDRVVYCFLRDDGNGKLDEEFDPNRYVWAEWHDEFVAWLADPRYSARRAARLHERCAAVRRGRLIAAIHHTATRACPG